MTEIISLNLALFLLSFFSGLCTTGIQMTISRLLAPFFGTGLLVWTLIIGSIMLAISLGNKIGGSWADKSNNLAKLCDILFYPSLFIAVIPLISNPLFRIAQEALKKQQPTLFISLFAFIILFAIPLTFYAMTGPFAIKLGTKKVEESGATAGKVNAFIAAGSLIGIYIPGVFSIPLWGSRYSILFFAAILLILTAFIKKDLIQGLVSVIVITICINFYPGSIIESKYVIYETESPYHYIQVHQKKKKIGMDRVVTQLVLNEGNATHSVHFSWQPWVYGVWDFFSTLIFIAPENRNETDILLIGMAAGTISNQLQSKDLNIKNLEIDGVEIDPDIYKVAKKYFQLNEKYMNVHIMDGRIFALKTKKKYDFIFCDAYKQPYIPFHLTTREYFKLLKNRLKPGGIIAINVGSTREENKVVKMIYNTLLSTFPYLCRIKIDHGGKPFQNYLVIASDFEISRKNFANLPHSIFAWHKSKIQNNFARIDRDASTGILTDDKAPVELLTEYTIFKVVADIVKHKLGLLSSSPKK
ncbi:spermidine synthase [Candidatus Riflebacteria bacterium]